MSRIYKETVMDLFIILALWMVWGLWGYKVGISKGYSSLEGFIAGVLLGPLTFLLYFAASRGKKCPLCGELVKLEANICRYCHSELESKEKAA